MIGNDIIDLNLIRAQSNWQREGFLRKLFSEDEQTLIQNSQDPELNVWLLWSMKEAAYKAVQRKYKLKRFYNPKQFICEQVTINPGKARGMVCYKEDVFGINSILFPNMIHTSTGNTEFSRISENKNSRLRLLQKIAEQRDISLEYLNIGKDREGIPFVSYRGDNLQIPFSFSHHGSFSAYAVSLNMS